MSWIARLFLRAKSWEIALLLLGIMLASMVAMVDSIQATPVGSFGKDSLPFVGLTLSFMFVSIGWFGAAGSFLNSIVQPGLRPGSRLFRFSLVYPLLYTAAFLIVFPPSPTMLLVIFPLHLVAIFCVFYLPIFVSKNLALVEMGKDVTFYDYAGPFFLLWFLPIGLWIVQPRINKLYAETTFSAA
ncbi:MAG: hypothetical protein WB683_17255 [Candidatus Sulfotelmatobacter sp.]